MGTLIGSSPKGSCIFRSALAEGHWSRGQAAPEGQATGSDQIADGEKGRVVSHYAAWVNMVPGTDTLRRSCVRLIGVDCAVAPRGVGIALAELGDMIEVGAVHANVGDPWDRVAEWIRDSPGETLVAIDAPLGWPAPLSVALHRHRAGTPVGSCANRLFRRSTDVLVHEAIGKRPLDVGADRIARTAHAALDRLDELRATTGLALALAWDPDEVRGTQVIEVYPAATLRAHGLPSEGYKKGNDSDHRGVRERILEMLAGVTVDEFSRSVAVTNADALDAVVCVLAAADFVRGMARRPDDAALARVEGWIWCKST